MRFLALTLALCFGVASFAVTPLEAASRRSSALHTVKAKKSKKTPRAHKAKKPAKHTARGAN